MCLLQGEHCAIVTVTVEGMTVTPAVAGFPSKFTSSQKVCWYRISTQAKATFAFDMCTSKYCECQLERQLICRPVLQFMKHVTLLWDALQTERERKLTFEWLKSAHVLMTSLLLFAWLSDNGIQWSGRINTFGCLLLLPHAAAAVTVNVSGVAPLSQNLTQGGENLEIDGKQALLFRPVIHLFGRKNRTLDGEVVKVRTHE